MMHAVVAVTHVIVEHAVGIKVPPSITIDSLKGAIEVKDSLWTIRAFWASVAAALGTLALAGVTVWLAGRTSSLATETGEALKQTQRHHEQSLMPFLKVTERASAVQARRNDDDTSLLDYALSGGLLNKGLGIAIAPRFFLEAFSNLYEFKGEKTKERPPNPAVGIKDDSITLGDYKPRVYTGLSYDGNHAKPFTFIVEYEDIFGATFRTLYDHKSARFVRYDKANNKELPLSGQYPPTA